MNNILDNALGNFSNKEVIRIINALKRNPTALEQESKKSTDTLYNISNLANWLYIIDEKEAALQLAAVIDNLPFTGKDMEEWERVVAVLVIESFIHQEQGNLAKAEKCIDTIRATYAIGDEGKIKILLRVLNRVLSGSLLYDDKIKAAQSSGDSLSEINWRFAQFTKLAYMKAMGGSETYPIERLDAEIAIEKEFLKEQVAAKNQTEKSSNRKKGKISGSPIEQCWTHIEDYLREKGENVVKILQPGATEDQIDWAESMLGTKLPDDFLEFYKIHNGQKSRTQGIIDGEELLSLERIVEEWKIWHELVLKGTFDDTLASSDEGVQEVWFNLSWIPFTYDGSGNHLCIDLAPAPRGYRGQVIRIWHDDAGRFREAPSFTTWIANFVHDMGE